MIAVCYKNYCETIAVKTEMLMLWYKLKQRDTVILLRELHVCWVASDRKLFLNNNHTF